MINLSLIVKITLSPFAPAFSTPSAAETRCPVRLSFDSTLQLLNSISSDLQKLLRYFNGATVVVFFKIELFASATAFPNYLALYWKDLKALLFAVSALKSVASSLE